MNLLESANISEKKVGCYKTLKNLLSYIKLIKKLRLLAIMKLKNKNFISIKTLFF